MCSHVGCKRVGPLGKAGEPKKKRVHFLESRRSLFHFVFHVVVPVIVWRRATAFTLPENHVRCVVEGLKLLSRAEYRFVFL